MAPKRIFHGRQGGFIILEPSALTRLNPVGGLIARQPHRVHYGGRVLLQSPSVASHNNRWTGRRLRGGQPGSRSQVLANAEGVLLGIVSRTVQPMGTQRGRESDRVKT